MIGWQTRDLPRETIARIIGADTLARVLALAPQAAYCHATVRASGAWYANLREEHAAYASLVTIVRTLPGGDAAK